MPLVDVLNLGPLRTQLVPRDDVLADGAAERRYAAITHIDVNRRDESEVSRLCNWILTVFDPVLNPKPATATLDTAADSRWAV